MQTQPESSLYQRHLYSIDIYDEDTVLTDYTEEAHKRYLVEKDQLMKFFRSNICFKPEKGLIQVETDGIKSIYIYDLAPQTRTIMVLARNAKEPQAFEVEVPGLIVKASISESNQGFTVHSLNLACYAGRKWTDKKPLYELALPNISDTSLCLGSGASDIEARTAREAIEFAIFETPFNTHNNICGKANLSFQAFHQKHQGRFPFSQLNRVDWNPLEKEARDFY
ncbi:hypothetical protein [Geoalkalibacter subterraneus]|uniref:Uncharacterized protein n=1 Tax=Geoalkalibacter subterraneus TaxID=483547 RepID=A0A0B5FLH5_9BACT|nr:hypothetical protein [Geoalkalibacter subterraneus]AJF08288.1 hypothetical protein GSUB_17585 [Geoalkalibacter subterraneus]